ncbi:MAG: hypothetical protein LBR54_01475 [Oscillospiraceae bacterium]|nr:hypothetical protein [Oscillospiraceae bacterium]
MPVQVRPAAPLTCFLKKKVSKEKPTFFLKKESRQRKTDLVLTLDCGQKEKLTFFLKKKVSKEKLI